MKPLPLKKLLVLILTSVYFSTQVALGALAESNIWAERQKARADQKSLLTDTQLASLPLSLNPHQNNLLDQLPSIKSALPSYPKWSGSKPNQHLKISPRLKTLLDAVPLGYGSIQDIYDSGKSDEAPLVLLQDVHLNLEAQTNLGQILQELINQKQVGLVGVEGAFTPFDFKSFRAFPNKQITKEVTEAFLKKNILAAPSYVGITSPVDPPDFLGIDDLPSYQANVQAYLDSRDLKENRARQIEKAKLQLNEQKAKIFSPELKNFDDLRSGYHRGDIEFGKYIQRLVNIDSSSGDLTLAQFLEAYEMESSLDFNQVDRERRRVLEKLTKVLSQAELSDLLAQSLAYRMGRVGFGPYYQGLKNLCEEKRIPLRQSPALDEYIRYVLLSDGIKADELFKSVEKLEQKISTSLAKTKEEKDLLEQSERLLLKGKLIEFSLTPMEWKRYRETNFKSQTLNSKKIPNLNLQTPNLEFLYLEIESWRL